MADEQFPIVNIGDLIHVTRDGIDGFPPTWCEVIHLQECSDKTLEPLMLVNAPDKKINVWAFKCDRSFADIHSLPSKYVDKTILWFRRGLFTCLKIKNAGSVSGSNKKEDEKMRLGKFLATKDDCPRPENSPWEFL